MRISDHIFQSNFVKMIKNRADKNIFELARAKFCKTISRTKKSRQSRPTQLQLYHAGQSLITRRSYFSFAEKNVTFFDLVGPVETNLSWVKQSRA